VTGESDSSAVISKTDAEPRGSMERKLGFLISGDAEAMGVVGAEMLGRGAGEIEGAGDGEGVGATELPESRSGMGLKWLQGNGGSSVTLGGGSGLPATPAGGGSCSSAGRGRLLVRFNWPLLPNCAGSGDGGDDESGVSSVNT
jgi:hypothetical protein